MFLLAGCVELHVRQQFYPNGRSSVLQQIYIGEAVQTLSNAGFSPPEPFNSTPQGWSDYIQSSCQTVGQKEVGAMCHRDGDWLIIDQDRVSGSDYSFNSYESFPYTIYDLKIYRMPAPPLAELGNIGVARAPLDGGLTNATDASIKQVRAAGAAYKYLLVMPGEVVNYNAGRLTEAGIEVDVLSQMSSHQILRVKSRALNLQQLALLIIVGLDILLFFDLFAIWVFREYSRRRAEAERKRREIEEEEGRHHIVPKNKKLRGYEVYKAKDDEKEEMPPAPDYEELGDLSDNPES